VVKTEERYEPTFSYRWDLLEAWLPDAVRAGRRLSRVAALDHLVSRYVRAAVYTRPRVLARLFAVPLTEIEAASARLIRRGALIESHVDGWSGQWLVDATLAARLL
jgi:hypothetical protein